MISPPDEDDLSTCAYFQSGRPGADPNGTCSFGCYTEPACITDQPTGGWPRERKIVRLAEWLRAETVTLLSRAGQMVDDPERSLAGEAAFEQSARDLLHLLEEDQ